MNKNKINVYINSKHYENTNDFEVSLPPGFIKCNPRTEYIVMNVNGWIMKNNFYNTQNSNNKYSVSTIHSWPKYDFTIPVGNYNVLELMTILNTQLNPYNVTVTYEDTLNKYKFTNNNDTVSWELTADTAHDFLGFYKNESKIIEPNSSIISSIPINMAGDELVILQMPNIQPKYPVIDDFKNGIMKNSSIVAYLSINAPPFALLEYKNWDGGDSFSYRLENTELDSLRLVCFNQDLEKIEVGDYQLNLQFEIHSKNTEYQILARMERLVSNIFQIAAKDIE